MKVGISSENKMTLSSHYVMVSRQKIFLQCILAVPMSKFINNNLVKFRPCKMTSSFQKWRYYIKWKLFSAEKKKKNEREKRLF